jgi:hypothetical protein
MGVTLNKQKILRDARCKGLRGDQKVRNSSYLHAEKEGRSARLAVKLDGASNRARYEFVAGADDTGTDSSKLGEGILEEIEVRGVALGTLVNDLWGESLAGGPKNALK